VKIPRAWKIDRLENKISADELYILCWLALLANPHNGKTKASFEEIVSDLSIKGKDPKNKVNKIMLSLKKKKRLWYPTQQGRRSSFIVEIGGYLLSTKRPKDIGRRFTDDPDRSEEESAQDYDIENEEEESSDSTDDANEDTEEQKSESPYSDEKYEQPTKKYPSQNRSTNNDNDIDSNKNNNSYSGLLRGGKTNSSEQTDDSGVTRYIPKTKEEERCKEIAIWLEEKSINFILSKLKELDNDMTKIEEAYDDTWRAVMSKGDVIRKGRYFNSVLGKKMKEVDFY